MKSKIINILFASIIYIFPIFLFGQLPNLRSTVTFALFTNAGAFDNVGASSVKGDIGSKTYTPTGFPPGIISGSIFNASDGQSTLAATDVALLYDDLSRTPTGVVSPTLGGQVLIAGVYSTGVGAAANLSGDITLDAQGNPDALFIIRIDGALGVSGSANVLLINSASPNNVFWQINGAFSLGISGVFRGTIVSAGAISLLSNSTLIGKGLTKAGAIELNANTVITNINPADPTLTIIQPTCAVATGSITVTAPIATGMTYSIDGFTYSNTSGVFSSLAAGNYNVIAKDIDGFVSGITVATINTQPPTPTAPIVGAITQPTCTVATGSVQLSGLPLGNWTINPGAITGSGATTTINNLVAGTYNYTVTNADGCTSLASANVLINTQPPTPTAPIVGAITQPTCTVATGSVELSGLPLGNWTINPGAINGTGTSTTINNLVAGTYNYTVTNADGCTSLASANVLINTQPPTPTAPIVGAITQPTCTVATGSVQLSGLPLGNWTINPGAITGSGATTTINNLVAGTYNYTVTNSDGCTSLASANVLINTQPPTPTAPIVGAITQPTCTVATGSVQLSGLPLGNWTINPGAITGSGATTTINNLLAGTYNYTVTNADGCTSLASANVLINTQPPTPTAPIVGAITQPTCTVATGSVELSGLPLGNWTINPGAITGSGATTTINNLLAGTYNYTVTNADGCTSLPSANILINTQPATPTAPIVGAITQPTCTVATGSVQLSGLPLGNWTINPGAITGSGATTTINNLLAGTYNYTVTNADGCTSLASANVLINTQPPTPTAPIVGAITQPTCTVATGSVQLSGLPLGNWTINPGAINGTGTSTTINNLVAGTYNYTVTNADGCTSLASANVLINTQPATPTAPIVGAITQPTCTVATGSVQLSGLPLGNWTINPGAITGSGATTTINNLVAGTYNYTVTNADGCTSLASANVLINTQPPTPTAPIVGAITQPTCTVATGSVQLSGLPLGNWTINPGAITGSGATTTINNLVAGTYNYTVTNADGCTSLASANVLINTQPPTPTAPIVGAITQPTCTVATGSVQLSGLPLGNWTINPGAITGSGATTTINNLVAGTYNYTVTNADGCTSLASANVLINTQPPTPTAPIVGAITQPTCTVATGSVELSGLPLGNWTINPGAINGTGTSTTINNLVAGTYNYTVTNADGCTSLASANVLINTQPPTPTAPIVGAITQPTCTVATGSVELSGLPLGNWTINPGAINGTGTSTTINNLLAGTYNYTVTNSDGCTSLPSANILINTQPPTPTSPIVGAITQPTCTVATGSVQLSGLPLGNWTINPGAITGSGSTTTINNLLAGTYNYTVTNADGCTSLPSANILINTQPPTPTAPIVGAITQPTCTVATGSVQLSGLPLGNWTINPGAITGSGATTTINNLLAGTYNYTVTNADGCTSLPSANILINTQPATPTAPIVGAITQPTCTVATGSVQLSGLPLGNWTINPGAITGSGSTTTINNLLAGTYNYTVTNADGCTSLPSANILINTQPATPTAPIVGAITQPTCTVATGSVELSGLPLGNWTINPGAITGSGATTTINNLLAGTYNYTVTNADGCISLASANVLINTQPATPTAPIVGAITQPTCTVATGSVELSGLPLGNWTINPGAINGTGTSTTINNLLAGTYNYTVTNADGCTSLASANVLINTQPPTPTAPIVGAITQPTCTVATGSVQLSGLPLGNWTINPGAINGTGTSTTINNLVAGTYNYTVTNADGCTSLASANVLINTQPPTPTAPIVGAITQPTCTVATGSVQLSGLPLGNWTINPGAINGTGTSTTINNLVAGTYNYTVTNADGCTSLASANVLINTQPPTPTAPIVGAITQPTCTVATGSVQLSGLPLGNWTINPGAITGSGATTTINNLLAGTYNYTVTNSDGCTSLASANVLINTQPATPIADAGISKEICINSSALIGTTAKVGNTYLWSSMPSGFISDLATQFVSPIVTTAYTVVETVIATGCFSSSTIIIAVKSLPANAGLITGLTQVCKGKTNVIYTVPSILNATGYIWTLPNGARIIAGANTNRILVSYDANAVNGNVTVYGTNSCGIGVAQSIAIKLTDCSLADLSATVTASNMAPIVGQTISLTIIANNLGPFDATGVTIDNNLLSGYSYLSSSSSDYDPFTGIWTIGNLSNGIPNTLIIMVKVNNIGNYTNTAIIDGNEPDINMSNNISTVIPIPTDFFLPEGFSPNRDGINDLFVIRGILSYPNNHFTIFNRWGNKVFETKQYRNTWNGKSTMGLRIGGDDLPTGTYFYLLDLGNGSKIIKGTIYLNR